MAAMRLGPALVFLLGCADRPLPLSDPNDPASNQASPKSTDSCPSTNSCRFHIALQFSNVTGKTGSTNPVDLCFNSADLSDRYSIGTTTWGSENAPYFDLEMFPPSDSEVRHVWPGVPWSSSEVNIGVSWTVGSIDSLDFSGEDGTMTISNVQFSGFDFTIVTPMVNDLPTPSGSFLLSACGTAPSGH